MVALSNLHALIIALGCLVVASECLVDDMGGFPSNATRYHTWVDRKHSAYSKTYSTASLTAGTRGCRECRSSLIWRQHERWAQDDESHTQLLSSIMMSVRVQPYQCECTDREEGDWYPTDTLDGLAFLRPILSSPSPLISEGTLWQAKD